MQTTDSRLPHILRWFFIVAALIVGIGGSLFLAPGLVSARWLWPLAPFNARFLGSVYLTEMILIVAVVLVNRWSVARPFLPVGMTFSLVVFVASLLHLDQFNPQRRATWGWFILYAGAVIFVIYLMWRYQKLPTGRRFELPEIWLRILPIKAIVLGLYGVGMFFFPAAATSFWPWPIDAFHSRVYSAFFISVGVGVWTILHSGSPAAWRALGFGHAVFSLSAALSVVWVDASLQRVAWTSPQPWLWFGALAILFLLGVALIWQSATMVTSPGQKSPVI